MTREPQKMYVEVDYEVVEGDDAFLPFKALDGNDDPVDLHGLGVEWRMTALNDRDDVKIYKSRGDGVELTDAANGELEVHLTSEETSQHEGVFYYDLKLSDDADHVSTVVRGEITISDAALGT